MNDETGPIIVPSAELVAVVRHDDVPTAVPDELTPYVRPVVRDGATVDWLLTEDTLAFADVTVPLQFAGWRTAWERSWMLDPLSSLERLVAAAQEFEVSAPSTTLLERVLHPGSTGPSGDVVHAILEPGEAGRLAAVFEALRDAIADRGRKGWGFVDATPGRQRVGLARSWSGQTGPEILVADRHVSVSIDVATGVSVVVTDDDGCRHRTCRRGHRGRDQRRPRRHPIRRRHGLARPPCGSRAQLADARLQPLAGAAGPGGPGVGSHVRRHPGVRRLLGSARPSGPAHVAATV